ncbi:MAG TPA: ADOP family duplicated permease [Thermoanaerobaculia bacterium]|nr:ADOP family duplicated permease [Thermoanaerobaculia bacterium]
MSAGQAGRSDPREREAAEIRRQVDDEIRDHLERRAAALIERGMSPTEAIAEARRRFGSLDEVRRECLEQQARRRRRAARRTRIGDLGRDLRLAVRRLRRRPGFTAASTVTLGLGLGALLALVALVDAVVLRPLPYPDAGRLVSVWPDVKSRGELDGVESLSALDLVAAYQDGLWLTLRGAEEPMRVAAAAVTPSLFQVLGQTPIAGRRLELEDGASGARRAVISERLWRRAWGSDPTLVGRAVEIDGRSWEIVGILPSRFHFPHADTEVWIPLQRDDSNLGAYWGFYELRLIGRLAADASTTRAEAELRELAGRLRLANPVWTPAEEYGREARVVPLQRQMAGGELRRLLGILLGAVAALVLVVCVNVAGLMLARAGAHQREVAVRASLGAARGRLVFEQLVESLVLAGGGVTVGLLVASGLVGSVAAGLDGVDARFGPIGLDGRLALVAGLLVLATATAIGLWPALRVSAAPLALLPGRGAGGARSGTRARRLLVAAQVALSVVLVSAAALLLVSLWNLVRVDPGFDGGAVLSARVDPPAEPYADGERSLDLYRRVLARLGSTPGVVSVAAASALPLDGGQLRMAFPASGLAVEEGRLPMAVRRVVTPGYFATLGIPLLEGRDFDARDAPGGPRVAIVNRTLADTIWPGRRALGERVGMAWERVAEIEIVGVVEDALQETLDATVEPELYFPLAQMPRSELLVAVRASGDPMAQAGVLRATVAAVDEQIPVSDLRTVRAVALRSISDARVTAALIAALAGLALVMAAVGVFGVVASLVDERRREIGVRVALGATPTHLTRSVLRQGLALGALGGTAGLLAAGAANRVLRSFLFEASSLETGVLAAVPLALVLVCVAASWLPARRAASIDPARTLRAE